MIDHCTVYFVEDGGEEKVLYDVSLPYFPTFESGQRVSIRSKVQTGHENEWRPEVNLWKDYIVSSTSQAFTRSYGESVGSIREGHELYVYVREKAIRE